MYKREKRHKLDDHKMVQNIQGNHQTILRDYSINMNLHEGHGFQPGRTTRPSCTQTHKALPLRGRQVMLCVILETDGQQYIRTGNRKL